MTQESKPLRAVISGKSVSPGYAVGPAWILDRAATSGCAPEVPVRHGGGPTSRSSSTGTWDDLSRAIDKARDDLTQLATESDDIGAEILEFQIVLLDDEEILDPVKEAIEEGMDPRNAWQSHLGEMAREFEECGDDHMAGRAADIRDLSDRVTRGLSGASEAETVPAGSVVVADEIPPSTFLSMDWTRLAGAALIRGSTTDHVAILAKARGVPMIAGMGRQPEIEQGETLALDATDGCLLVHPEREDLDRIADGKRQHAVEEKMAAAIEMEPARTADGDRIKVLINVNTPADIEGFDFRCCDGIGLVRTEFLFSEGLAGEESQYDVYADIVRRADGKLVTFRTLDAGGDKPVPGFTIEGENNPFLGVRGIRLSLRHPEVFETQLRALARAAAHGPVRIMLPMISVPPEIVASRHQLESVLAELDATETPRGVPELGMMIEVPAAALDAKSFDVDFYSIGTNDLVQYTMAAARDVGDLSDLCDPLNPAVSQMIKRSVSAARERNADIGICGDMASDAVFVPHLLDLGLASLSVPPALVGQVKLAISTHKRGDQP